MKNINELKEFGIFEQIIAVFENREKIKEEMENNCDKVLNECNVFMKQKILDIFIEFLFFVHC